MQFFQLALTCAATWFFSGKFPKAPGTVGSLAALPFGWIIFILLGNTGLFAFSVILFAIGIIVADRYSKLIGVHDAGEIVIDEVVGQWLCLIAVPLSGSWFDLIGIFLAFIVFRAFDIVKPWPIRVIDRRVGGGFGIMLDDVFAAIFGMIVLFLGYRLLGM